MGVLAELLVLASLAWLLFLEDLDLLLDSISSLNSSKSNFPSLFRSYFSKTASIWASVMDLDVRFISALVK